MDGALRCNFLCSYLNPRATARGILHSIRAAPRIQAQAERGSASSGRSPGMSKRPRRDDDPLVRVSKEMSRLLRHSPPPGTMDDQGWVALPTLLQHLRGKPSEEVVRQVVQQDAKGRFVLDDVTTPPRIRASQGHSVQLENPILQPLLSPEAVPVAVHVTGRQAWEEISASGELRRMARTHIHFATLPHMMRNNSWANVLLRLDLAAAMAEGHAFFLSDNSVLLCEGPLPVKFVRQVQVADLPEEWGAAAALGGAPQGRGSGPGRGAGSGLAPGQRPSGSRGPAGP